jgi:hypothetical protein
LSRIRLPEHYHTYKLEAQLTTVEQYHAATATA